MLSKIFPSLLNRHHKLVLDSLRGRRAFSLEGQVEVADYFIDNLRRVVNFPWVDQPKRGVTFEKKMNRFAKQ